MKPLKAKHRNRLLHLIARDIDAAASIARTAAKAAAHHAKAGRADQAFQQILEAEPALFDATKLVTLAMYVKTIGNDREE